ncbi:MAG: hypothetical protein BWX88_02953 [Planctomycetes bacterium ADurb.Bin126]|nr:MAG: hypothetical protein BWX88_02953 [Planctomycetes bacterium ADurb.Bin126]HOD80599.1 PEP-CTERM sorting domain-containing protein [Phycisphaerae bacterium]HQL74074.1 PEP-CTERM sorting domain-containing protein [Phycisphaerae bacterium]
MTTIRSLYALVAVLVLFVSVLPADGAMVSLWTLNEAAGTTTAANSIATGPVGSLYNGADFVVDAVRGQVLHFDGSDDYATAGNIPALAVGSDYTWSFWSSSAQGPNNNVMFGNRYDGGSSWCKFTTSKFEYVPNGSAQHLEYDDIAANSGWMYHVVVKSGNTLTYYRDGQLKGSRTITADMPSLPLRWGGDPTTERWGGNMDNIALFDHPLTAAEVNYAMIGNYSRFSAVKATSLQDDFSAGLDKWDAVTKGLESNAASGYDAPSVSGGQLTLGGTTTSQYWRGSSVAGKDLFDVPAGGELRFDVDRVSLSGSAGASGLRSSLWMYADDGNYVHFSQNTEASRGFGYNANNNNPTGGGVNLARADYLDSNYGNHSMSMVHDGSYVKMYVDGRYLGSQAATFSSNIAMMLTGQARATGETVQAVFDNASASTRTFTHMYDNFNSGSIDPAKWTVIRKGLEHAGDFPGNLAASVQDGVLTISGSTGSQYWYGVTLQSAVQFPSENGATFTVQREALSKSGSAGRSSVWIWADDNNFLHFSDNFGENGWQYNYADGTRTGVSVGSGINIPAFDSMDGDDLSHEMTVMLRREGATLYMDMYLDDVLGATRQFDNWGDRTFYYMLTGQPRASGDSVYAAFDNVEINIPEPLTLGLLSLAGAALGGYVRRRRR